MNAKHTMEVRFTPFGKKENGTTALVTIEPMDDGASFLRWLGIGAPYFAEASWTDAEGQAWRQVLRARLDGKIRGKNPGAALEKAKWALVEYHQNSRFICGHCAGLNEGQPKPHKVDRRTFDVEDISELHPAR